MRTLTLSTVLSVLLLAGPAGAQPPPPVEDPGSMLRNWYRDFLGREITPREWSYYLPRIKDHDSAAKALAEIVSTNEYYQRAGSTPEGFVRALYANVTGRQPPPQELADLARRVARGNDRDTRHDIAHNLVRRFSQGWRWPADPAQHGYLAGVRESARQLAQELERLQEDIVVELGGPKERDLYQRADEALQLVRHFHQSIRAGFDRQHLYKDFHAMDQRLHELLEAVRARGRDRASLQRTVNRIEHLDNQLHAALSHGDTGDERRREVLRRQTQSLIAEARELERTAQYAVTTAGEGADLVKHLGAFLTAADHYARSLQQGAGLDHLQRDFVTVERAWTRVVEAVNGLPARSRNTYLRSRAQRVDAVFDQVHDLLGLKGDRTRVVIPFGQGG